MGYLDILRNDAKLAENFDTLFDFRLLDALKVAARSLCPVWHLL